MLVAIGVARTTVSNVSQRHLLFDYQAKIIVALSLLASHRCCNIELSPVSREYFSLKPQGMHAGHSHPKLSLPAGCLGPNLEPELATPTF